MRARGVLLAGFIILSVTIMAQIIYFSKTHALSPESITCKESFTSLVGLPDLALVSEAHFIRHRSLSDVFSAFADAPELLEYFPSTFVYHAASLPIPSRIERAH